MKKIVIKDWHILPDWGKGLSIGSILGSILVIPASLFSFIDPDFIYLSPAVFLISCLTGVFIFTKYRTFSKIRMLKRLEKTNSFS